MQPPLPNACPEENLFVELLQGALPDDERAALNDHLDACPACAALILALGQMLGADADDTDAALVAGRYELLQQVGAGGMGVVYEALDRTLRRKVALKLLRAELLDAAQREDYSARLLREARLLASISHPHVLPVYDVGTWGDQVFMAMHFVEGDAVGRWQRRLQPAWRQILGVYLKAGEGLAEAHQRQLVHRDVKPDNILIGRDGGVWLTDFGLACNVKAQLQRPRGDDPRGDDTDILRSVLTRTGAVMGTPAYMSPEQYMGRDVDARSDQFSFCAALFESIYNERPFPGTTRQELEDAVCAGRLKPPPRATAAPPALYRALAIGLSLDPAGRHPSMSALLDRLRLLHSPPSRPSRAPLWISLALAVTALTALALGLQAPPDLRDRCRDGDLDACEALADQILDRDLHKSSEVVTDERRTPFLDDLASLQPRLEEACLRQMPASCTAAGFLGVLLKQDPNDEDNSGGFPIADQLPPFIAHMQTACQLRDLRACRMLRDAYGEGLYDDDDNGPNAIKPDPQTLQQHLGPLCDSGLADACWMLSEQFLDSLGLKRNLRRHMHWLERGCAADHIPSCLYAGAGWWDVDPQTCQDHFNLVGRYLPDHYVLPPSADKEDVEAFCHRYSIFQDDSKALELLKKPCDGHPDTPEGKAACAIHERAALQTLARAARQDRDGCLAQEPGACQRFAAQLLQSYFLEHTQTIDDDFYDELREVTQGADDALDHGCTARGEGAACVAAAFVYTLRRQRDLDYPQKDQVQGFLARVDTGCRVGDWRACALVDDAHNLALYEKQGFQPNTEHWEKILSEGCQVGAARACWMLAEGRYVSHHIPRDLAQSLRWMEVGCRQNHALSCAMAALFWWDAPDPTQRALMQTLGGEMVDNNILSVPDDEDLDKLLLETAPWRDNDRARELAARGCALTPDDGDDASAEGKTLACALQKALHTAQ
jgi:serine/threonine protein kinase/TPR repeat protein